MQVTTSYLHSRQDVYIVVERRQYGS